MLKHLMAVAYDMEPVSRLMFALGTRAFDQNSKAPSALLFAILSETGNLPATENAATILSELEEVDQDEDRETRDREGGGGQKEVVVGEVDHGASSSERDRDASISLLVKTPVPVFMTR